MSEELNIEYKKTDELIPYVNNPKEHPEEQIDKIASSIKEFGFKNPIIIDKDNTIIAGHGRHKATKKLGIEKVPCIKAKDLTKEQVKAYRIADNRIAQSSWDDELLSVELEDLEELDIDKELTGFDTEELNEYHDLSNDVEEDEYEVPDEDEIQTDIEKGEVFKLGDHYLMCGDATKEKDVERLLNDVKIDLMFTDPPYGVQYADKNKFLNSIDKGNQNQDEIEGDHDDLKDVKELWRKFLNKTKPYFEKYSTYYITAPQGGELLYNIFDVLKKEKYQLKHTLIWNKNNHVLGRADYNYKHEPILYGWINKHKHVGNGKHKTSVWNISKPQQSKKHPTMKPIELVTNAILNSSKKGKRVYDPFGGSGSTLIACEQTNRKCYMMELEPKYCQVIIDRWQEYTGKEAEKIKSVSGESGE